MAGRLRLSAWAGIAGLLALGALLAWPPPSAALDWQPQRFAAEPWRAFSAAWVHWSPQHLLANLAGCAVLAWFGGAARLGARSALAWALAWPLTQLGLLLQPGLAHFGGLSGVLHAGVAVAVVELLGRAGRERRIGALIGVGLLLKLGLEQPFGAPLRVVAGWDIAIVPFSHLSGVLAGTLTATLCSAISALAGRRRRRLRA